MYFLILTDFYKYCIVDDEIFLINIFNFNHILEFQNYYLLSKNNIWMIYYLEECIQFKCKSIFPINNIIKLNEICMYCNIKNFSFLLLIK